MAHKTLESLSSAVRLAKLAQDKRLARLAKEEKHRKSVIQLIHDAVLLGVMSPQEAVFKVLDEVGPLTEMEILQATAYRLGCTALTRGGAGPHRLREVKVQRSEWDGGPVVKDVRAFDLDIPN